MFVKDLRGVVHGLQRAESAAGSRYKFSLQVERGQAVLVDCEATMPVVEGETVLVSGPKDTDGMVTAEVITEVILPTPVSVTPTPTGKLPVVRLIVLAILADVFGLVATMILLPGPHTSGGVQFMTLLLFAAIAGAILGAFGHKEHRTRRIRLTAGAAVLIPSFIGMVIKVMQ